MVLAFTHRNEFVISLSLYCCSFHHVLCVFFLSFFSSFFALLLPSSFRLQSHNNTHLLLIYLFIILEYLICRQNNDVKKTRNETNLILMENAENCALHELNLINTIGTATLISSLRQKCIFLIQLDLHYNLI